MTDTPETAAQRGHVLYVTGDPDAPNSIKDRNGEVVLSHCRVCNGGESELEETCASRLAKEKAELERKLGKMRSQLSRETLISDDYGVHGSTFYICPFCSAESGAGVLNKGVPHEKGCILHGDTNPCESIVMIAQERDDARMDAEALRTALSESQAALQKAEALATDWMRKNDEKAMAACKLLDESISTQLANRRLREALKRVARYGENHDGCCPYGCDTPTIASDALSAPSDEQLIDRVVEVLNGIDDQLSILFWTSEDGWTQRGGKPEDCDAPEALCKVWTLALQLRDDLKGAANE